MIDPLENLSLQTAYVQQLGEVGSNWIVYDKNGKEIWELGINLSARDAMNAVRLARQAEMNAYEAGVETGILKEQLERIKKGLGD